MTSNNRISGKEQVMMQRIIATLFSLAVLLERSCYGPAPVRWFLVKLLLPVEPMIRWFVIGTAWRMGAVALLLPDPVEPDVDVREQAFQLAECFHAFARSLQDLPKQLYHRWRNCAALDQALTSLAKKRSALSEPIAAPALQYLPPLIDTS